MVEVPVHIVSVEEPEPVMVAGLKLAVAPAGSPLVLNDTAPLKPLIGVMVMVTLPQAPAVTVSEEDDAVSEKSVTTKVTVAECVRLPLVPVMVRVKLPVGVVLLVVTLNVELPDPVTEVGLKPAVAPGGNPLTLKETLAAKQFDAPTVAV